MADQGFPSSHTTQTTTTTVSTATSKPFFDPAYVKTVPGILKIVCIILSILMLISVAVAFHYGGTTGWCEFVATVGFLVSTTLLFLYLFHILGMFSQVPWFLCEFIYCLAWAILMFTAATSAAVVAAKYSGYFNVGGWGATAFFGYGAMVVYAIDAWFKFRAWRSGERPQVSVISQSSHTSSVSSAPKQTVP